MFSVLLKVKTAVLERCLRAPATGIGRSTFDLDDYGHSIYHIVCFAPALPGSTRVAQRRGELDSVKAEPLPDVC